MKKAIIGTFLILILAAPAFAKTAIFNLPFNTQTRQTTLPVAPEGQEPYRISWTHLEHEKNGKVKTQVTADDAIVDLMKADSSYGWVEDVVEQDKANP